VSESEKPSKEPLFSWLYKLWTTASILPISVLTASQLKLHMIVTHAGSLSSLTLIWLCICSPFFCNFRNCYLEKVLSLLVSTSDSVSTANNNCRNPTGIPDHDNCNFHSVSQLPSYWCSLVVTSASLQLYRVTGIWQQLYQLICPWGLQVVQTWRTTFCLEWQSTLTNCHTHSFWPLMIPTVYWQHWKLQLGLLSTTGLAHQTLVNLLALLKFNVYNRIWH